MIWEFMQSQSSCINFLGLLQQMPQPGQFKTAEMSSLTALEVRSLKSGRQRRCPQGRILPASASFWGDSSPWLLGKWMHHPSLRFRLLLSFCLKSPSDEDTRYWI